jgi:glycine/D-amino acid oxidase-like deaminating enzyme
MERTADVVIIGAGVIGAAIAYELGLRGYETVNVDKLPAAGHGSTSNSCSIVRAHYSSLDAVALAHDGFAYWERWPEYLDCEDELGYARYVQVGTLLFERGDRDRERVLRHYSELGVEHEELDPDAVTDRWPMLDLHSFWPPSRPEDDEFWRTPEALLDGAVFTPRSGYVNDPQLASHNLQRAAEAKGGHFLFRTEVTAITRAGDRVTGVELRGGDRIAAPIVVNAAGPHSAQINRMAGAEDGMRIMTRALRHEVHHVPAPEGVDFQADGCHVSDGDSGIYFRPETGNHILIGSEDPACDPKEWVDDPDSFERGVTRAQWEAQVYRLARRMPALKIPNARRGVVDLYDVSDDWIPIYDASDVGGFYMAIGTSGNQFKNAAPVGHLMAELIDRCEGGHDHDADPVKVTCRNTGKTVNAGYYSRRREINPDSSFSVNG